MKPIPEIIRTSDWESVKDAADRLGVTRQRIHQMVREHKVRAVKFGDRTTMIHRKDIEHLLAKRNKVVPY